MMYEPSIRVPMLARYPDGFDGGRVDRDHMVLNNDVAHTILDYCGVARPASMRGHGESWRPLLERRPVPWRDAWMYEYFEYPAITCTGKMRGIRTDRWKLIHYIQNPQAYELFDLEQDPEERLNLYDKPEHRSRAAGLKARLEAMRTELGDDRGEDATPAAACTMRIADLPYR
jgi:arylsulfatase A-like enzyme